MADPAGRLEQRTEHELDDGGRDGGRKPGEGAFRAGGDDEPERRLAHLAR